MPLPVRPDTDTHTARLNFGKSLPGGAVPEKLSDYGFFQGNIAQQQPAAGVVPYALNTPLFSDYAEKLRFMKLPDGRAVAYNDSAVLDFPVGTTLIKTFYFPTDFRDPAKGRRLMETRLTGASGFRMESV